MGNHQSAIEDSLKQLIEDTPYKKISVQDICENAHVSRKSFYMYYSSKNDVVASIFEKDVILPIKSINSILSSSQAFDMYSVLYENLYEAIYKSRTFYIKLVAPMRGKDDVFLKIATKAIYDLNIAILASYDFKGDELKADYVSYFFASSQAMLIQKWISDGMPYTPKELASLYDEMTCKFWLTTFGS